VRCSEKLADRPSSVIPATCRSLGVVDTGVGVQVAGAIQGKPGGLDILDGLSAGRGPSEWTPRPGAKAPRSRRPEIGMLIGRHRVAFQALRWGPGECRSISGTHPHPAGAPMLKIIPTDDWRCVTEGRMIDLGPDHPRTTKVGR